jgi:hypothetical protein
MRASFRAVALTAAALIVSSASGGPVDGRDADAAPHVGARGVMRTVLEGDRVEEIPLVFLGTYRGAAGPGHDIHLVRLDGERASHVGVAAGMSGSPVFVDGRLVGALAYRFGGLSKEPIGGVTPFEDMRRARRASGGVAATPGGPTRIGTPLVVSGVTEPIRDLLAAELERFGFVMVPGGAGSGGPEAPRALEPGSAVGVELVRGDLRLAAVGTVTWVDGDTVWAFGHRFLGAGRVEMPMVTAEVIHTLAGLDGSFKLANPGVEVGAILDDRLAAVVGRTGVRAAMLPVELRVRGGDYGEQRFGFEVLRRSELTPLLVGAVVGNALQANLGFDQDATFLGRGSVRLRGLPELPLSFAATSGGRHPVISAVQEVQAVLDLLYRNPFAEPEVEAIRFDLEVRRERLRYQVEEVLHDRGPLRPGTQLAVDVVLRGYRDRRTTHRLLVEIPGDIDPGTPLVLAVGSADYVSRAQGRPIEARVRTAGDLPTLVRALSEKRPGNALVALLFRPSGGILADGFAYTGLPPTAVELMSRSGSGQVSTRSASAFESELELDGPVDGGALIRFEAGRMPH